MKFNNKLALVASLVSIWFLHGIITRSEGYTPDWSGTNRLLYSPRGEQDDVGASRVKGPLMFMS